MFEVRDGALISRRTGQTALVEKGPDGFSMVRLMVDGRMRRLAVARVAWAIQFGAWSTGIVRLRSDGGGYGADNLIETRRGQNPYAVGQASLIKRAERDLSLLAALAGNPGATVPTLSRLAGMGPTCACLRLAALADKGWCAGPKCDARARWDLTPAGKALAVAGRPLLDDLDRDLLSTLAAASMGAVKLARRAGVCPPTVRRRAGQLAKRGLVFADPRKFYSITPVGIEALGPDAAKPPPRWLDPGRISAASAKDVTGRTFIPEATAATRSNAGKLARAAAKRNRSTPFNGGGYFERGMAEAS